MPNLKFAGGCRGKFDFADLWWTQLDGLVDELDVVVGIKEALEE